MSDWYKKTRGLYVAGSNVPYKVSRSKIDLFVECPRCFYLDQKIGIRRPSMPAFTLNSAVDILLKKEFDIHRINKEPHPLMKHYGIDAIPFAHDQLDEWRENFKGMRYHHEPTNFIVSGAVDDLWINNQEEIHVVDYKSTSKDEEMKELNSIWHEGYKRQMAVYQWILRKLGYTVSSLGYFVYANGNKDKEAFDGKLEFDLTIISHEADTSWIEDTLHLMKEALEKNELPETGERCEYCPYTFARKDIEQQEEKRD